MGVTKPSMRPILSRQKSGGCRRKVPELRPLNEPAGVDGVGREPAPERRPREYRETRPLSLRVPPPRRPAPAQCAACRPLPRGARSMMLISRRSSVIRSPLCVLRWYRPCAKSVPPMTRRGPATPPPAHGLGSFMYWPRACCLRALGKKG